MPSRAVWGSGRNFIARAPLSKKAEWKKTEKEVNSKNQPCNHHQSIFIHFLTSLILPPAFFGRSPLQGVEDLDLEQATLRAKSLASGGQQLSGMKGGMSRKQQRWMEASFFNFSTWKWDMIW